MRLFKRKSRQQQLLETVKDTLVAPIAAGLRSLPDRLPDKTVKVGAIAAGGLTGLTAGSAGISSLRHRSEGEEKGDS